ncbi:hypothetical protein, partial [Bifidobacterium longum]|uniref:hypothetical protein n=1 Tax=Bifidobacterium longum TaxID=216816 RepID=UPI001F2F77EE
MGVLALAPLTVALVADLDAVEGADLQVERDLRVVAHAGGGYADLAQAGGPRAADGDAVDVVGLVELVG